MEVTYGEELFNVTSIKHARYIFKKHFEEDEDFRHVYVANIAMLLHDRYGITNHKTRNDMADEIMAVIFDAKDIKPTVCDEKDKIKDRFEIMDL